MKRIAVILLMLCLALSCLVGCEDDRTDENTQEKDPIATDTHGDETGLLPEVPF
ncbi:MAG: hypothetical protein ACI3YH_04230 [Eubacteriales bacterium]